MHNSTHPRFRAFNLISIVRTVMLALAFVGANAFMPSARADDSPMTDPTADDNKPAEITMKFDPHWNFNLHTEYPGASGTMDITPEDKSLKLNFDFSKGGSFVSAGHSVDSRLSFATIAVRAKGFGALGLSITDNSGQTFVYNFGIPGEMERTYEANLSAPSLSFGGLNDKVVHFPLQNINVTVSKSKDYLSGTVEITEVLLKAAK